MVLITNTHIHWDPEFSDVKLVQTAILLNSIKNILGQLTREHNLPENSIPVIMCGDFNSDPSSGVVELINSGSVPENHNDFMSFDYENCLKKFMTKCKPKPKNNKDEYSISMKLDSAYDLSPENPTVFYNYFFKFIFNNFKVRIYYGSKYDVFL